MRWRRRFRPRDRKRGEAITSVATVGLIHASPTVIYRASGGGRQESSAHQIGGCRLRRCEVPDERAGPRAGSGRLVLTRMLQDRNVVDGSEPVVIVQAVADNKLVWDIREAHIFRVDIEL
jgi:hypothetical protein